MLGDHDAAKSSTLHDVSSIDHTGGNNAWQGSWHGDYEWYGDSCDKFSTYWDDQDWQDPEPTADAQNTG
eukprot:4035465-Pyramimonas_sp.AAC.1